MKLPARACPGPELLGLLFGGTISAAINLLTALALNGAQGHIHTKIVIGGWGLLIGSSAVGGLAIAVGQRRSEVLDGLGGTVSSAERKALVQQELEKISVVILVLELIWVASIVFAMIALTS